MASQEHPFCTASMYYTILISWEDFVFDAMHTILLRNIKRHLDYYKENGFLNDNVENGLGNIPWTAGTYRTLIH